MRFARPRKLRYLTRGLSPRLPPQLCAGLKVYCFLIAFTFAFLSRTFTAHRCVVTTFGRVRYPRHKSPTGHEKTPKYNTRQTLYNLRRELVGPSSRTILILRQNVLCISNVVFSSLLFVSARSAAFVFVSAAKAEGFRRDDSLWVTRYASNPIADWLVVNRVAICRVHNFRVPRRRRKISISINIPLH